MRIIISLLSPILTQLAMKINVFLKYLEILREYWVSTKPSFILLFSVLSLRLRRYLASILKLAIWGLNSESFTELLNHTEILGKRKKEGKKLKALPPKPSFYLNRKHFCILCFCCKRPTGILAEIYTQKPSESSLLHITGLWDSTILLHFEIAFLKNSGRISSPFRGYSQSFHL